MPTTQVINYQQDPGQAQMLEAGKNIADSLYKSQSLKLTGQYYKILAQNADTATKQFQLDRKSKTMDMLTKISETADPTTKSMLIKALIDGPYQGDAQTAMHDIADSHNDVQQQYMNMKQSPGTASPQQLAGAQMQNQQAEAMGHKAGAANQIAMANIMRQQMNLPILGEDGNPVQNQPAVQDTTSQGGNGAPAPNTARTNLVMSGISAGQPQFVNLGAKQREATAQSFGTAEGNQQQTAQTLAPTIKEYYKAFNQAINESGGSSNSAAEAGIKNILGRAVAGLRPGGSGFTTLDALKQPLSLQLGALINKGRPTEPDAVAGSRMLPDPALPRSTNEAITRALKGIMGYKETGNTMQDANYRQGLARQVSIMKQTDKAFYESAKSAGKTDAQINAYLDQQHQKLGF